MNIERHGHIKEQSVKARCGGPSMCKVCQLEQAHDEAVSIASELVKPWAYQFSMGIGSAANLILQGILKSKGLIA
jgi:hypothetical protein